MYREGLQAGVVEPVLEGVGALDLAVHDLELDAAAARVREKVGLAEGELGVDAGLLLALLDRAGEDALDNARVALAAVDMDVLLAQREHPLQQQLLDDALVLAVVLGHRLER